MFFSCCARLGCDAAPLRGQGQGQDWRGEFGGGSTTGVRHGSIEGPVLFLFTVQAAMETLQWPGGVTRPDNSNRKRDATPFELWDSLFAEDCALIFNSCDDLITGSKYIFSQLCKFGL
jgi:hypothetical protein